MDGFGIRLDKEKALKQQMIQLGIRDADIVENFIRSSGPGGQNVNKTSTCVRLVHSPTGIEVKCQKERSQALNRFRARQLLIRKIENRLIGRLSQEQQRIAKIRRQKRRRSRRAKLKLLEFKRRHGQKKLMRSRVRQIEE
jgi:protein subunit release factor B